MAFAAGGYKVYIMGNNDDNFSFGQALRAGHGPLVKFGVTGARALHPAPEFPALTWWQYENLRERMPEE